MEKYILGGGLSGLVAAYYNSEYKLLAPEFGGFVDSEYGRAFVVLHATDGMRELFDELGVPCFEKRIQIGYYDSVWDGVQESVYGEEETFARRYVEEKLPERFQPGKDLELSAPGDSWEALFVDSSIVGKLVEEVDKTERCEVAEISDGEMSLVKPTGDEITVVYERLVSTIPAPIFRRLSDADWSLDYVPTTYAKLPRGVVPDRYLTKPWNILYTVDKGVEYHRVVKNMLSSRYFVECLENVDVYGAYDQITNGFGVISDEELEAPYPGITFLGRYAEWRHERRIDHVVEIAREGLQ